MSEQTGRRRPLHLWIVGVLSLLWNAFGVFDYLGTHLPIEAYVAQMAPELVAHLSTYPAWAVAAWAFGVWGAFAGSIGLLLARAWAVWMFALSLAGLAVNTIYNFALSGGAEAIGGGAALTVAIWVVGIALLAYSIQQKRRGVLR